VVGPRRQNFGCAVREGVLSSSDKAEDLSQPSHDVPVTRTADVRTLVCSLDKAPRLRDTSQMVTTVKAVGLSTKPPPPRTYERSGCSNCLSCFARVPWGRDVYSFLYRRRVAVGL